MRYGLVCEGATDFITVANFLSEALARKGVSADFIDLQPGLDKTSEMNCGWANALLWLKKNNLKQRKVTILGQGLFSGKLGSKKCDAIIILLDSDCAADGGFFNFCKKHIGLIPKGSSRVEALMFAIENFSELSGEVAIAEHHVMSVAEHNSESWCAAVLPEEPPRNVEIISIPETNELVLAAISELPKANLIDEDRRLKDRDLRYEFCKFNYGKTDRLEQRSGSFKKLVLDAVEVSTD